MYASRITAVDPYVRERVAVLDTEMAYVANLAVMSGTHSGT